MGIEQGVRAALRGHRQVDVAEQLGVAQNTISRWATGMAVPGLDEIWNLEAACGRPHGFVLRAAGYLDDIRSVPEAVAMDMELDEPGRDAVLAVYQVMVSQRKLRQGGDRSETSL